MKDIKYIIFIVLLFIGLGCSEEDRLDHIDDSAPAPEQPVITQIINKSGGAIIKYDIPNDKNLLGITAEYERQQGVISETKSSLYLDSLVIEGFGDTLTHVVNVYSVGRNGKKSDPVQVNINPSSPPVAIATKNIEATFGGVAIKFTNKARSALALVLMVDSTNSGYWEPVETFYTEAPSGSFYARGMDSKEAKFGIYIRDRWNNKSDTLAQNLIPVEEEEISKANFENLPLPGDTWEYIQTASYSVEHAWDGIIGVRSNIFACKNSEPIPQRFTISLGFETSISRFKFYQRPGDEYSGATPRTFELWGSMDPPADGSWDNWYLLGKFEAFKPSGYKEDGSVGTITADDKNYATNQGVDCELTVTDNVSEPFKTVKYLRFKTTSTYASYGTDATTGQIVVAELTFWGQIKN